MRTFFYFIIVFAGLFDHKNLIAVIQPPHFVRTNTRLVVKPGAVFVRADINAFDIRKNAGALARRRIGIAIGFILAVFTVDVFGIRFKIFTARRVLHCGALGLRFAVIRGHKALGVVVHADETRHLIERAARVAAHAAGGDGRIHAERGAGAGKRASQQAAADALEFHPAGFNVFKLHAARHEIAAQHVNGCAVVHFKKVGRDMA